MTRLQANALLVLTAAIWGTAFVAQKFGMDHAGAFSFSGARFLLGALVIAPIAWHSYRRLKEQGVRLTPGDWLGMIATGAVLCAGGLLQQIGIAATSVTNAGFLTGLYVPLVPIIALAAQRILPHPVVWPAAAASVLGTWFLSGGGSVSTSWGDLLVIVSTVFWAAHVVLVGHMAARTGAPTVLALVQFTVAGLIASVLAFFLETDPVEGVIAAWPAVAYTGILSVGVAFTLQSIAQRYTAAADAAIILSCEVVFAAIGGALVFGDTLTDNQLMGCGIIFAAMLAVQLVPLFLPGRTHRSGRS